MPPRFLVFGPSWLGDAVMAIPTYRALRRGFPDAHVAVVARGSVHDLYGCIPDVDEVIPYHRPAGMARLAAYTGLIERLRRVRADTALVLPRSFGSAWTAVLSDAPRRIGYATAGRRFLLTDPVPRDPGLLRIHRVRYLQHLLAPLGIDAPAEAPRLVVPAAAAAAAERLLEPLHRAGSAGIVALIPGANYGAAKQWPEERYVALARHLLDAGLALVLLGAPGDKSVCDRIQDALAGAPVLDLSGRTTVPELAAVLERAQLAVSNDTGAMHVAAAVATPVVAVFGPTDPVTTAPYGTEHVVLREPVDCAPCLLRECPIDHRCMLGVDVARVAAACDDLLARVAGGARRG